MSTDLGDADRIDGGDLEDEEEVAPEPHHLAPVARHDGLFLLRRQAEAVEIGALVLLEGLTVFRPAQAHGHLVDAVPAQGPLAVEERRVGNPILLWLLVHDVMSPSLRRRACPRAWSQSPTSATRR